MVKAETQRARVHDEPRSDETREQDEQDEIEDKEYGADRLEPAESIRLLTQQRRHYGKENNGHYFGTYGYISRNFASEMRHHVAKLGKKRRKKGRRYDQLTRQWTILDRKLESKSGLLTGARRHGTLEPRPREMRHALLDRHAP